MSFLQQGLYELQELTLLTFRAFYRLRKKPRYFREVIQQIDIIGVGSTPIILLTGFFTGAVLVLQSFQILAYYGAQSQVGRMVTFSLFRELGPVLAGLMVAGRIGSAITAELGSMVVSQQIDAMRALGTDPVKKLVAPRIIALLVALPLLTVVANVSGIIGGGITSKYIFNLDTTVFISSVLDAITTKNIIVTLVKPFFFGLIIGSVACYKGLGTTGGTVGVGISTTRSVVLSSIVIIIADFFLTRALQNILGIDF
ncbi:MAG: ABC transporter permease [Pyrinomonadaceae bacterium]|nr:ABC transporter permease [Pyrinomonadaceae bacterium]MCX7640013.1 ABC transporter permease [Pyrinomonadaceae bacterium]MDW8304185.1 ABC transporter permease [Acidobacteriota bacterium]